MYAQIILPVAVRGVFTYRIPDDLIPSIATGSLVVVQFAARRHYIGCVYSLAEESSVENTKEVLEVLEDIQPLDPIVLKIWKWISDYYLCSEGEVLHAGLPAGLKLDHNLWVDKGSLFEEIDDQRLSLLFPDEGMPMQELMERIGGDFKMSRFRSWLDNEYLILRDSWSQRGRKLGEKAIRRRADEEGLHEFLSKSSAPRQKELLLHFLELEIDRPYVLRKELCPRPFSSTLLKAVLDKGILEEYLLDPLETDAVFNAGLHDLSPEQNQALESIQSSFDKDKPVLLYGVTSSGKTEIYTHLIHETLQKGQQAIFLLPEIALTTQMIRRLQAFFGQEVLVYHSMMPDKKRTEVWKRVNRGDPVLVLAARSGLLLPFSKLGLLVVDEEHEVTYKQQDPAPRYNARDTALYSAMQHGASIVMGSATPSLESLENVSQGRFDMVKLTKRYGNFSLPEIQLSNTSKLKDEDEQVGPELIKAIEETLERDEQVILFQNRRGFSPYVICNSCGEVPGCPNCDISLSYHKYGNWLRCHYCGHKEVFEPDCKVCRLGQKQVQGVGTQRLEEKLKTLFPDVGIERLDLDSSRSREKLQRLIDRFEKRQTKILIGTQMVTKGLDFQNVGLVGVISADGLLSYPDFRTGERCFQLIAQVSGRAGRGIEGGKVLIQSRNTTLDILKDLRDYSYEAIYDRERFYRKSFDYPPFSRVIKILLAHSGREEVQEAARTMSKVLTRLFGRKVLGPEQPPVGRLKNKYLQQFLIKLPREGSPVRHKQALVDNLEALQKQRWLKGVRIIIDVDPVQ